MFYQKKFPVYVVLFLLLAACSAEKQNTTTSAQLAIIPKPLQAIARSGQFLFSASTRLRLKVEDPGFQLAAEYLQKKFKKAAGWDFPLEQSRDEGTGNVIFVKDEKIKHPEGYLLEISPQKVQISAQTGAGAFYAIQSLIQLLPPAIESAAPLPGSMEWKVTCARVKDEPRFGYRGLHLDVGRHHFPVDFIKKYIDILAGYKMNRFHWHLTEDQGWRIEIEKYPKLQEVAAYRKETLKGHYNEQPQRFDGQRYGGYYTKTNIRDIVQYAKERFVTIIPEIEMPGHAQAALAAYPELSCTGGPFEVATGWGVKEEVFCPKEETFQFLEDVLTEVMDLFPGEYIHIGGDECPKERWKTCSHCQQLIKDHNLENEHGLQSYFIKRIEKFVNEKGRRIIGWDEILEGGLAPDATVMSWRGEQGGIEAAQQGHDVVMTPSTYVYLDYYQSTHPDEPLAIGGFLPLSTVYAYDPLPAALTPEEQKHILGAQANLWTEYIRSPKKAEYMAFPRGLALAEVVWSMPEQKNFQDFVKRLDTHFERFQASGTEIARHIHHVDNEVVAGTGEGVNVKLSTALQGLEIRYTTDESDPDSSATLYDQPIPIFQNLTLKAASFQNGRRLSPVMERAFQWHLAAGKKISLTHAPAAKYSSGGTGAILNAGIGSDDRYGDTDWLGFEGSDLEAAIDLGQPLEIKQAQLRFFNGPGQWIYPPQSVEVLTSADGIQYESRVKKVLTNQTGKIVVVNLVFEPQTVRYLKVNAINYGPIPEGKEGAGHPAWLFVDELVIE